MCLRPRNGSGTLSALPVRNYVLLNPLKAGLVKSPETWPYLGAVIPGYPRVSPFDTGYWPWFWQHYFTLCEAGIEKRLLPPREME
jgi:hypothetical protein